jgi:hypothetical protein
MKTYKIVAEHEDCEDEVLEKGLNLFDAETFLCYYINHGEDAYIMEDE